MLQYLCIGYIHLDVYKRRLQGLRTIEGPKFNRLQWGVFILKIILKEPEMHVINDMNHHFDGIIYFSPFRLPNSPSPWRINLICINLNLLFSMTPCKVWFHSSQHLWMFLISCYEYLCFSHVDCNSEFSTIKLM
jgi:hypothetical protein